MRSLVKPLALAVLIFLHATCTGDTPTNILHAPGLLSKFVTSSELPIPVDSIFEDEPMMAVARELPSTFAGFWYGEDGHVVVGLTDETDLEAATVLIRPWLGDSNPKAFTAHRMEFPFLLLAAYRTILRRDVFEIPGVVAIGVNETENRVKVAIEHGAVEAQVRDLMNELGVPSEIVIFPTMPRAHKATVYLSSAQPDGEVQGGWHIAYSPTHACTLGFPALDPLMSTPKSL
jgi:hypothetical protein